MFDVENKTAKCSVEYLKSKRRAIKVGNSLWTNKKRGHSKINDQIICNMYALITHHPQVFNHHFLMIVSKLYLIFRKDDNWFQNWYCMCSLYYIQSICVVLLLFQWPWTLNTKRVGDRYSQNVIILDFCSRLKLSSEFSF